MASIDVPAGRPVAVPAVTGVVAKPTHITWLTLAFMTPASVASLRSAPTTPATASTSSTASGMESNLTLTIHEPPYMIEGETHELEPGVCFSTEPGIYVPGRFGVRVEDIIVAAEDGDRRLNNTSHELRLVS